MVNVLEPRLARGVGPEQERLRAVYGSHDPRFAIPFAFPISPDEHGGYAWTMSFDAGEPRITITVGHLDLSRIGYLYRLPAETFEPIKEWQWISCEPVTPLDYTLIHPQEYAHWIEHEAKQ